MISSPTGPDTSTWAPLTSHDHFVQFYHQDSVLTAAVSGFCAGALRNGGVAIVAATSSHRKAIEKQLETDGFDLTALKESGGFVALDAEELLAKFMVKGLPDDALFIQTIGQIVAQAARNGREVRVFGELVALLCQQENTEAAVRLEDLWNHLARRYTFALFCAYPWSSLREGRSGTPFVHICGKHSHVID